MGNDESRIDLDLHLCFDPPKKAIDFYYFILFKRMKFVCDIGVGHA
jgi:hypothetical protein